MRFDGRVELAVVQLFPIDVLEPRVVLDVGCATTKAAETLCWIDDAEFGDEVLGVCGHAGGVLDSAFDDSEGRVRAKRLRESVCYTYCS